MKCKIREWNLNDAKSLAKILSNQNILNNLRDGLPYPYTEKDATDYITAMLEADKNDTFAYAIDVEGEVVGSIGVFRQSNIHSQTAELGYYLDEEYWGKGIMTDAVNQICKKIFDETNILRIFAEPFSYNAGSRKVLEKSGFAFEGILKNNAVKNEKPVDMAIYALTRDFGEFQVRRLNVEDISNALKLIWEVFNQFEAQEYSKRGVDEFYNTLNNSDWIKKINFYGAFNKNNLVGVLGIRKPQHIGFFFVLADFQRKGIGKMLFEAMQKDYFCKEFTVNSSPFAVKIYEKLGFEATSQEKNSNGIRYIPMIFKQK